MNVQHARLLISNFKYFCKALSITCFDYSRPPGIENIGQIKPFDPAQHQMDLIEYIESGKNTDRIILKGRQIGATTIILAFLLWTILYHRAENIVYLCHLDTRAYKNFRICRDWVNKLGEYAPKVKFRDSAIINEFASSMIDFTTATTMKGRADTYTTSVGDEISYYKDSVQLSLRSGFNASSPRRRIWLSTPYRENDLYHMMCESAKEKNDLFYCDFWDKRLLSWFGTEDNRQLWFENFTEGMSQAEINREYLCLFKGAVSSPIWDTPETIYYTRSDNAANGVIVSLDPGYSPDPTAILYAEIKNGKLIIFDEDQVYQKTSGEIANKILNKNYRLLYGVMDSSGKSTDKTSGISVYTDLTKRLGIRFYTRKPPDRILLRNHAQRMLNKEQILVANKCKKLIEVFNNFQYENYDKIPTRSAYKHLHDAFVYLAYNFDKNCNSNKLSPRMMPRNLLPSQLW